MDRVPTFFMDTARPGVKPVPSLLDLLDKNHAKATFFVMGWRLLPKTYGERHEYRTDKTCLDAAHEVVRRGHEIENHTFSHVQLKQFEQRKGEAAAVADVDHGAQLIKTVTGSQPHYLRPPDWIMPSDLEKDLQHRGWTVLTISSEMPVAIRDINSLDYLCAGKATQCPKPSLEASVLKTIEAREKKGITTHLIAFHELSTTVAALRSAAAGTARPRISVRDSAGLHESCGRETRPSDDQGTAVRMTNTLHKVFRSPSRCSFSARFPSPSRLLNPSLPSTPPSRNRASTGREPQNLFSRSAPDLGQNFEPELWKYLGDDVDKQDKISNFLLYPEYLHGNLPMPYLAMQIQLKSLTTLRGKPDLSSRIMYVTTSINAAILDGSLGLLEEAEVHKTEAESMMAKDKFLATGFPAIDDYDRCIYDSLGDREIARPRDNLCPKENRW